VNRAIRRPFLALILAAFVIAGWLGLPPAAAPDATGIVKGPPPPVAAAASPVAVAVGADVSGRPTPVPSRTPSPRLTPSPAPGASQGAAGPTITQTPGHGGTASAAAMLGASLDVRLEALRAKSGIPGVSASIVFADGSVWRGTAGFADVAAARRVTTDTAFPVASVSKTFTSALILGLVEDGKLGLDSRVKSYLPRLAIDPATTVRQLLDHTSGLRDFYFHAGIDHALLSAPARVWNAARSLSYVGKPFAKPGVSWHYSNTNYLILGLLAEAVGGGSVADQLRDRFFRPLGLYHTYYQYAEAPQGPVVHSYRFTGTSLKLPAIDLSDGSKVAPFTSVVTAAGAAGSIATTSADLARWAQALYGGTVLDPVSRAALVGDVLRTARYKPTVAYGLGVQSVTIDGHPTLGHSGRFLGARAAVRWLLDEQVAIAVLTNQSRSDPNVIVADLLKVALPPQVVCIACPADP
jgi:D-alanyl-D-alanine carboxypeptidase